MERETIASAVPAALLVLVGIIICRSLWHPLIEAEDLSTIELQDPVDSVKAVCNKTLNPELCYSSLFSYPSQPIKLLLPCSNGGTLNPELCYSSLFPHLGSSPSQPIKLLLLALMVALDEDA